MSFISSKLGWPRKRRAGSTGGETTGLGWTRLAEEAEQTPVVERSETAGVVSGEDRTGVSIAAAESAPGVAEASAEEDVRPPVVSSAPAPAVAAPVRADAVSRETAPESSAAVVTRRDVARILTISNQKGGVGKTTTTVNLAAAMAMSGLRVLVIDLDPQGNASTGLGIPHPIGTPSSYNVIVDKAPLIDVVQQVEAPGVPDGMLSCVPATSDLAGAEVELAGVMVGREFRLKQAINDYLALHEGDDRFDYVLVDCPPSLGLLTVNALAAAGEVLIPVQCEYYALEGLGQLLETVELIKGYLNPELEVSTMLLTMFDARTKLAGQVVDDVREHFGDVVMRTVIPRSVKVSEAPSYGLSVMSYDPASRGAVAYAAAAQELIGRR